MDNPTNKKKGFKQSRPKKGRRILMIFARVEKSKWRNISNLDSFNNCLGVLDLLMIDFVYNKEHIYASFLLMQLLLVCPRSKKIDDFLYKHS